MLTGKKRSKIQDTKTQDSRLKTQDSRLKTQDSIKIKLKFMKYLVLAVIIFITGCAEQPKTFNAYTASIKDFQYELNKEFADPKRSPLTAEDIKIFKELDFFLIDSTYKVKGNFILNKNPILFEMPTTTDRLPVYKTYGEVTFKLQGKELKLHVYQNQDLIKKAKYKNHLFIPFMDKTNGNTSYGGGRYIDLEMPEGNLLIIDFNKAYNPYCTYNSKYSCPIPPRENNLEVAIKAGVKAYKNSK